MSSEIKRHPTKWDTASFSEAIEAISPEILVVGEYTKLDNRIECICKNCKTTWFPRAGNILRGTKCPLCTKEQQRQRQKGTQHEVRNNWTNESFLRRISEIDPNIEVLEDFINTASKIRCRCKICGLEWSPTANNLLQGKTHCPKCSKAASATKRSLSQEEFIQRVTAIDDSIEILGNYTGTKNRITCKCRKCGYIWNPTGDSLLQGKGCRSCAYTEHGDKTKTPQSVFKERLFAINPNIIVLSEYKGAYCRLKCRCKVCANEWDAVPHNLLTGRGCPNCAHTSTSYVEQFILQAFRKVLGAEAVVSRDKSTIGVELDIYIPQLSFAIEPGSWELHQGKTKRDTQKQMLCHNAGITLVTIYYDYRGPITNASNIITFANDISVPREYLTLVNLVKQLFKMATIENCSLTDVEWKEISSLAYINSRRINTKQFIDRLSTITNTIQVIGEYKSSKTKILCKCTICGNEWSITPNDLLSGRGCPTCARTSRSIKRSYSQTEFVEKVIEKNPTIEIIGLYHGNKARVECLCKKCGYKWAPIAGQLISKKASGCPKCAGTQKLTTSSFVSVMSDLNPNIEILGEYINTDTKIECCCKKCNKHWYTTPHILKAGHGCPSCSKKRNLPKEENN